MTKTWKKFVEEEKEEIAARKNLVIVDGTNLGFKFKTGGMPTDFSNSFVNTIQSLEKSYSAKKTIVLRDKGKSLFRLGLYPEYKANRNKKYEEKTEEEMLADKEFFKFLKEAYKATEQKLPLVFIDGVEADDIAALIVELLSGEYEHVWLISSDGDWDTLLSENVSRFSYKTRREYHLHNMYENHGCDDAEQFVSLKAIKGDEGDNIRGVEGIGDKRGYNLLKEYGNIFDIIDSMPLPGNQQFIKKLNSSEDLLMRNIMLVDLPSFCKEAIHAAGPTALEDLINRIMEIHNDSN